ncbi:MAG: hypothetical protein M3N53_03675 [Actinomycetota bacterium]|nr:hypothetical protein [Actinomycetota bacterium]
MARGRRAEDWDRDLDAARAGEARLATILREDHRIEALIDRTNDFDRLDFSFNYADSRVELDLKEKIKPTSEGLAALWPDVPPSDIFVLDETVYRRIVWNGGGGYLVVRDYPGHRWLIFGPWELTLGPRLRYERWGKRHEKSFKKGKVMLDLSTAAHSSHSFHVGDLLRVIDRALALRDAVEAVEISGIDLPEVGEP